MSYVRPCPRCGGADRRRNSCVRDVFASRCAIRSLLEVLPIPEEAASEAQSATTEEPPVTEADPSAGSDHCRNGHPMEAGEFMCMVCGEPPAVEPGNCTPEECADSPGKEIAPRVFNGWTLGAELRVISGESDLFLATRKSADGGEIGRDRRL